MNKSFLKITIVLITLINTINCFGMDNLGNPYKMYRDPVIENIESNPKLTKRLFKDVLNSRFDRIPYFCAQNRCYLYNFSNPTYCSLEPYTIAENNNNLEMIAWLQKNKCYDMRNSKYFKSGIMPTDLMINAYVGNFEQVKALLDNKNITLTKDSVDNALNAAIKNKDSLCIKPLLMYIRSSK